MTTKKAPAPKANAKAYSKANANAVFNRGLSRPALPTQAKRPVKAKRMSR